MGWWKLRAFRKLRRHETPQRLETPKPHGITSRIPFLPDEILLLIAELSDEQAQLHMTQTCHRLQRLVEPIFYRHIRVRRGHGLSGYRLHRTLAARPDLLPVIRSYHGPLIHKANNSEIITSSEPSRGKALWRKISTNTRKWLVNDLDSFERANIIFSGAVNIRVLHCTDAITEDGARILGALAIPLESTTTTNIQSLVLRIGPNSPQLAPILRTQLKLRHLELQLESYVPMRLEKDDLPELESLKAELRYAAEIVPGRPVKKIELLNDWTPDKDSLRQLALSKCRITEFTANIGFPHQDLRDFAIPLAPARYLRGVRRLCFRLVGPVLDFTLLQTIPAYQSISHLKLIGPVSQKQWRTYSDEWEPPLRCDAEDVGQLARGLAKSCSRLVEVEWCRTATSFCCGWVDKNRVRYLVNR